jgi:hypothetical protein
MAEVNPGQEQFRDAILTLRNQYIAAGLQPLFLLRSELVHSEDVADRGGMDTPSRDHFLQLLSHCDQVRRRVTHNPDPASLAEKIATAMNADLVIADAERPFGGDDIQMGTTGLYVLPYDLSGGDPNIPLTSALDMSGFGKIALLAIDTSIVAWTRLNSRTHSRFITRHDSLRIYGLYQQLFALLVTFGGDGNRVDVAQVEATDEPRGPENAANRKTETPGGAG